MNQIFRNALVWVCFFLLSPLFSAGAETSRPHILFQENPYLQDFNAAVIARFDSADPKTQNALDQTLADALTHYYDYNPVKAVQAFESFPEDYLTAEYRYLYADASLKAAEYETAENQYRRLLELDPRLHPARLGLSIAYFQQGDPNAARRELRRIEEEALPEYLRNRLAQLKTALEAPARAVHDFNFYLSQNIQWDSNIGVVPDDDLITAPNGAVYRFTGASEKEDGWRSETLARIYWDYERFMEKGFQWRTKGTLYNLEYIDSGRYDSFLWKIESGPDWRSGNWRVAAPVTYGQRFYSDSRLYDLYGVSPETTYRFNRWIRIKGRFGYFRKDYVDDEDDALDKYIQTYEIEPIFYYNTSWDYVALSLGWEEDRARASRYSDDSLRASLSASYHFREDIRGYIRYTHRFQDYPEPFPGWTSDREDDENSVYLSLTKNFSNGLFIDANFYYSHNDSNTDLFDYDRIICGAGLGFHF
ncbi:MAG: surface lipoprotein assembly modifier [Thermodesulfobacteriota bacterium]